MIDHPLKPLRLFSESRNEGEKCEHGYSVADIYVEGKILEWQRPSTIDYLQMTQ